MSKQRINAALEEASDTRDVNIGAGALASVPDVFRENFGEGPIVVVADGNTFEVAGKEVQRELEDAGYTMVEPYVFPAEPPLYAEYSNIEKLRDSLREHDAIPVAVGSGTLNDIVKRSSHECERPYMCVGTAASMDGYTAFGASIEKDGLKQTLSCPAPKAVVADLETLQNAPENMTASGYADLLGKVTSGADWLVADALGVEKIDPTGWSLVQDHLREWTASPAELRAGDQQSTEHLVEGLIMSGLGMQSYESSRTASGAEHQFSHLWEMEGLGKDADPPLSHGFKVGVGSVAIAALYELLLERDLA
jgi:glycerol-1-phosphate dehydrogenase [NAD(P)+]